MWPTRHRSRLLRVIPRRQYHSNLPLLDDLTQRGFIQDVTRRGQLENALLTNAQTVYAGVDPTANSLHIGHLIPLMCLLHFQIRGHRIIPLIGGATGRVGDPSGRLVERQLANIKQVDHNVVGLTSSIQTFFQRALLYASSRSQVQGDLLKEPKVISNLDWHGSFNLLDFLQKVGVHARVNAMMARDSVRARLASQQGLSFTEFTYQLLQAYDFYYLHEHHGCTIQVGGSDQWGNIVAGLELIGKLPTRGNPQAAYGITTPLLTTASGEKFGKSAGNAVWLDSKLTSIFDFYQYFLKVADADVEKYLKLFTLLTHEAIEEVLRTHALEPEKRTAQHRLASEVTEMVHLKTGATQASVMTKILFSSDYRDLKAEEIIFSLQHDPRLVTIPQQEMLELPITKLAAKYGLVVSNSAAKSLVSARGLYLNDSVIPSAQSKIGLSDLLDQRVAILRAGKDKIIVLTFPD